MKIEIPNNFHKFLENLGGIFTTPCILIKMKTPNWYLWILVMETNKRHSEKSIELIRHYYEGFFNIKAKPEDLSLMCELISPDLMCRCLKAIQDFQKAQKNPSLSNEATKHYSTMCAKIEHEFFDEFHYMFMGLDRGVFFNWVRKIKGTSLGSEPKWKRLEFQMRDRIALMREIGGLVGYRQDELKKEDIK